MTVSARMFLCARCRQQVLVCRECDRGQLYCGKACSQATRRERQRQARRRYAATRAGKFNNAMRQSRFRQRQIERQVSRSKIVTDQGSADTSPGHTLMPERVDKGSSAAIGCRFCGQLCSVLVRQGFLPPDQRFSHHHRREKATDP